jgi:hypothetical protein
MIAGLIFEKNQRNRKRAIWISVSSSLKSTAEQDMIDIGVRNKIKVYSLQKINYGSKISGFSTYSCLIAQSKLNGKYQTRMRQVVDRCGKDFDGLIVFDERHQAKNCVSIGFTESPQNWLRNPGITEQVAQGQNCLLFRYRYLGTPPYKLYGPFGTVG